jgi:hypothetical protein
MVSKGWALLQLVDDRRVPAPRFTFSLDGDM